MAINIFTHIRRGLYDNVYNCIEKEKVNVNQRDDDTGNPPLVVAVEENQIERRSNHSLITNRYRARILSHISPRLLRQIAIDIGLTVEEMLESR